MDLSVFGFGHDVGIDLGTANTLIYLKGQGIVLREPSVVAIDKYNGKVLAVGNRADEMLGRTPENITAIRPVKDGVIADFEITAAMIKSMLTDVLGRRRILRPRVMVCVPSGITQVERRAVSEAVINSGAKSVMLIEEPMAAALGAGIPVLDAKGAMVVDIGGGTCEVAVVSLGGIVASKSLRIAGNRLDDDIANYVKQAYSLTIGEKTAEEIKKELGSAAPYDGEGYYEVRGRDLISGLPSNIRISAKEVRDAMAETVSEMVNSVCEVLEKTPPELASDILETGITLTGGGALIRQLDRVLSERTHLDVRIAENPLDSVCTGTGKTLDIPELSKRSGFISGV